MATPNLKTYRAPTMAEALVEVKKALGKDAVILHARTFKVGGVLGVGGRQMVEITASDGADAVGPRLRPGSAQHPPESRPSPHAQSPVYSPQRPPAPVRPREAAPVEPRPMAQRVPATHAPFAPAHSEAADDLRAELASIKALVGQVLRSSRPTESTGAVLSRGGLPEPLMDLLLQLQRSGMPVELAEFCISRVREELRSPAPDPAALREVTLRALSGMLPVVGGAAKLNVQADGRPLTIAFVGPTGVGKTTTIAKLAATYKLRMNRRVAMITADTYRIAAVDQLRTYANIIGLPVKVAMTPEELAEAARSFAGYDVLLIDTAGRSPNDTARIEELRRVVEAAAPHETHLVVSAAIAEAVTLTTIERFRAVSPDRMIITKLDEAVGYGALVSIARAAGLPISHVTTGQEVPDDFETADARRLASLVLDGVLPS
ncbi:MAG: flagellar biosynthesis protein FlhF [Phycisphaerales bacterium]